MEQLPTAIERSAPAIAQPTIQMLVAGWSAARRHAIADEMFDAVLAEIPYLIEDQPLSSLGKSTCIAIVDLMVAMLEHGIPGNRAEPPVVAVEYARSAAERGLALEDLLRIYRLGHAWLSRSLTNAIMESTSDPAEQVRDVRDSESFLFTFIDVVSSKISAAYIAQREHILGRTAPTGRDVVQAILNGYDVDIKEAQQSLGHNLTGPQLAFACWGEGETTELRRAATAMQEVLNAPRPVLVTFEDNCLSGWFDLSHGARVSVENLAEAAGAAAPLVHTGLGPIMAGVNGFRESGVGAQRVRQVVSLAAKQPPSLTEWRSIALVDALSADLDAARRLVRTELGALNRVGEHIDMLRQTAHAFVVSGYSYAAVSSRLHIHRNTALQRVRKAEALRGRPLSERPAELLAALALVDVIGPKVLAP